MYDKVMVFSELASRRAHLARENILRALTKRIDAVPGGINLGQGVCDLDMPAPLREGALQSLREDRATYTPFAGIPELRSAIAARMQVQGLPYGPDEIVVTLGSSAAFSAVLLTLVEPGDEVVLFEPFYSYHQAGIPLAGGVPRYVRLEPPDFAFDPAALRAVLTPKTRAVVVNTPGNPSGKVWSREELGALARELEGTRVAVISDEVYEYLVYDGRAHVPPASLPELRDRTVTIGGLSKTYSITGWRLGWLAAPQEFAYAAGVVFDTLAVCAPRPLQVGAARALRELPPSFYEELRIDYQRRRDVLVSGLRAGGFQVWEPAGAYYVLAGFDGVLGAPDATAACYELIERARIAGVPADSFYRPGSKVRALRFHFAVREPVLREAAQRFAAFGDDPRTLS
jgi:aminotransferase